MALKPTSKTITEAPRRDISDHRYCGEHTRGQRFDETPNSQTDAKELTYPTIGLPGALDYRSHGLRRFLTDMLSS